MNCTSCGNPLGPAQKFCPKCGAPAAAPGTGAGVPRPPAAGQQSGTPWTPAQGIPQPPQATGVPPPPPPPQDSAFAQAFEQAPRPAAAYQTPRSRLSPLAIGAIAVVVIAVIGIVTCMKRSAGKIRPMTGKFVEERYKVSLEFPAEGWYEDAVSSGAGSLTTIGVFHRGKKAREVSLKIFQSPASGSVPAAFSDDLLRSTEPLLITSAENLLASQGYRYEHVKMSRYPLVGRDGVWLEGYSKKGDESYRTFLFIAFSKSKEIDLWFSFDERKTKEYWPEIKSIVDSLTFF